MRVFQMLMFLLLLAGFTSSSHAAPTVNADQAQMINADVGISNFDANFLQSTDQATIIQAGYTSTFIATILADPAEFWQQTQTNSAATTAGMRSQTSNLFSIAISGNVLKFTLSGKTTSNTFVLPQAILLNNVLSSINKNVVQISAPVRQVNFTAIAG